VPSDNRFEDGLTEDQVNTHATFWDKDYVPKKSIADVISEFGDIAEYSFSKVSEQSNDHPKLNLEERVLIYMYTMETPWCLYKNLNRAMRSRMKAEWLVYQDYIYYLEKALANIESYTQSEAKSVTKIVYRGIAEKLDKYNKGKTITWNSFSSCTTDATVAFNFMREKKRNNFYDFE